MVIFVGDVVQSLSEMLNCEKLKSWTCVGGEGGGGVVSKWGDEEVVMSTACGSSLFKVWMGVALGSDKDLSNLSG